MEEGRDISRVPSEGAKKSERNLTEAPNLPSLLLFPNKEKKGERKNGQAEPLKTGKVPDSRAVDIPRRTFTRTA